MVLRTTSDGKEMLVSLRHLRGQTVWMRNWFGDPNDIWGDELLTDSNNLTIGLVRGDMFFEFARPDIEPFTFNGLEINNGIHDTRENYDAYAQPTHIEGYVTYSNGDTDRIQLPIDVCAYQGYPTTAVMSEPYYDVVAFAFRVVETSGTQEYMAISEITIY